MSETLMFSRAFLENGRPESAKVSRALQEKFLLFGPQSQLASLPCRPLGSPAGAVRVVCRFRLPLLRRIPQDRDLPSSPSPVPVTHPRNNASATALQQRLAEIA